MSGTLTKAAVSGVANFSGNGLKIDKIGTGYTLTATDGSLTSATSGSFNITAGAATKLAYTTVPSTGTAGTAFSVTVQSQDADGNPASPTSTTTITLSKATGGGTLSGTLTGTIGSGGNSVTISTPVYSKSDTMTLTATATAGETGLTAVTSGNIVFSAGAAAKLAFTTQPGGGTGGTAWTTQPVVTVQDANGNTVTTDTSTVTVAIANNAGGGTLSGTLTEAAVAGVANFSGNGLSIDKIGTGYTLTATDGSLTSATSSGFNITAGTAIAVTVETAANGSGSVVGAQNITSGNAITVYAITRDAYGNFVANPSSTWSLTNITGGVVSGDLTPASGASSTFTGHVIGSAAIHLVNGSLSANSGTLTVVPGALAKYAVTATTPQTRSTAFNVTVTAQDANNNTVTADSSTVVTMTGTGSVQFDSNGDGAFGDNTKTLSSGTFIIAAKDGAAETITLTATSAGPKTGASGSVVINRTSQDLSYWKTITLDHTKVSADQSGFPVLINLASDANLSAHARSDGFDLLFTSSDGATILPYEREQYTNTTGALVAWVKVPTLSSTADTVLRLYYGNAGITNDQQDASNVWDSNYKAVWHLKENPRGTAPQMQDSTAGNNDGTTASAFAAGDQQAGEIGGGLNFGGATNYDVSIANEPNFDFERTNSFSIEYWAKPTGSTTTKPCPVSKLQNSGSFPGYEIGHNVRGPGGTNTAGQLRLSLVNTATGGTKHQVIVSPASATKLNDGSWHHYVFTYSGTGTGAGVKIYEDGVALSTVTDEDDLASNSILNSTPVHLGTRENAGNYYSGLLDEVRISSAVRSASWVATEWTNQAAPSSFYSVGAEQALTTTTVSRTSGASPSTYGDSLTFTATVSGGGTPTGNVIFKDGPAALSGGAYEFDLTQNIAGVPVITVRGKAGQTVKLDFVSI